MTRGSTQQRPDCPRGQQSAPARVCRQPPSVQPALAAWVSPLVRLCELLLVGLAFALPVGYELSGKESGTEFANPPPFVGPLTGFPSRTGLANSALDSFPENLQMELLLIVFTRPLYADSRAQVIDSLATSWIKWSCSSIMGHVLDSMLT